MEKDKRQGAHELITAQQPSADRPGPIENNCLLGRDDDPDTLKPDLTEGQQFRLLSEPAWRYLQEIYGGGPAIPRPVIRSKNGDRAFVEVHPMRLFITRSSDPKTKISIRVSESVRSVIHPAWSSSSHHCLFPAVNQTLHRCKSVLFSYKH